MSTTHPLISELKPWLKEIYYDLIVPRRIAIKNHDFIKAMELGSVGKHQALQYFSGLMWHLLDFGKHVAHLTNKRPLEIGTFLAGRSEDEDGDTEILGKIVKAFGGDPTEITHSPWTQKVHPIWIQHDALLRSAIYSTDFSWAVGTAALNIGIESLVPSMIEPLFRASVRTYQVSSNEAKWLESRSGEEEKQHGENGFFILNRFVDEHDSALLAQCRFYIEALSHSMANRLLLTGMKDASRPFISNLTS